MSNKRALNTEEVKGSCAKKRKTSNENNVNSPFPQVDGLTDNADNKAFGFVPNTTQTFNVSHSNYAPPNNANLFLNGHFAPKTPLDGGHFMPPNHFSSFMPPFGMPQRLQRMSSKEDSFKDFNEMPLQLMTSVPDVYKRLNSPQQGFINPTNGAFPRMIYPGHHNLSAVDQTLHVKNNEIQTPVNKFHGVGHIPTMDSSHPNYNSFLMKRKEFSLGDMSLLNRAEMMNPQNPLLFGDVRNIHPSFNNGAKSFPIQFPYLRLPNIPESSNAHDSYAHSKQFNHCLPLVPNNQFFPPRTFVPFPNPVPHWNPGLMEKREFMNTDLTLDGSINNVRHTTPKTDYLTQKSIPKVPMYSGNSNDPMKMIENFSASHFNNSFPSNVSSSSTARTEVCNKAERNDRSSQEKSSGKIQQNMKPVGQMQRNSEISSADNVANHVLQPPEKKTKRHKKNGEQVKYESWLYEKRNALQSRLMVLEQEMFSIPSSASSCQELKSHFESAIAQLRREGTEHEALIKAFESKKNVNTPVNKNDSSCSGVEDKPLKPAKSNGASQHLNSNMTPCPDAPNRTSNQPHPSSSYHCNDANEPVNACRPVADHKIYEDLPLPAIVEPSVPITCNINIKGWPPENEKQKLINFKRVVHDGFKPSDALKILNELPNEKCSKVLRMEDLSKNTTNQVNIDEMGIIAQEDPSKYLEFTILSKWFFMNRKNIAIESCSQCCKNMEGIPVLEEIVVMMGREKVTHNLKFCGGDCMKAHQEKRKIWERDKQMHEEFMEREANKQLNKDLNSTIIYDVDPNKTLPLDTSKENLFGISDHSSSPKKWKNTKYGTRRSLSHLKKRQKKEITQDEKKASHVFHSVHLPSGIADTRSCFLCGGEGDEDGNGSGRLLVMDIDKWVHANCSLWSSNVYEALDGTFVGSKNLSCATCACCNQAGATIMCFLPNCGLKFHLRCALHLGVCFLENKVTYCRHHCPKNMLSLIVKDISIKRRVCTERQENHQVAKMLSEDEPENFVMRSGNLIVCSIGHLLPQFIHTLNFNTTNYIYPVGYKSVRFYWSYRNLHRRCQYVCSIGERDGAPVFKINVEEENEDDVVFECNNCTGAWMHVLSRLDALRRSNGLSKVFTEYLSGEDLFGINEPAIRRVIESLPGVELLPNCHLRYGKSSMYVPPLAPNPSGCIRSEPKSRTLFKRSHTLLSNFNAGSSAKSAWFGSGEFSITQYMKQFTATKSQRYRSLKTEWRNNVYLRRSNIQGLGLFAGRELEQFTMVIEYIGEIIRNELSEIREKVYEQQNRGVYMFRLDENAVVDATMAGGPARYINHCCDPNCFTEVIPTDRGNKIVIITKRKIQSGEELSYDYKFNLEDEKSKIPCLCGAVNCMKWMN